jgi:GAF domain-containing protein/HAMP domain-containing protein
VGTYVPLGTPDLAVVIELPVTEAYQEVIRGAAMSVAIMLVMAMLAGLIGVYVAQRLAVPLLNLTETATLIAEGELNLQAAVEGPVETTRLANAFNSMTRQLRELIDSLEQRIADRTQRLEIVASLGEHLNAILDPGDLLREVVNQVKQNFGYYHTHIYLLDEAGENLVMAAGTGRAGEKMTASGHSISLKAPTSLVAQAARSREIVMVDDVQAAKDWLPNPLLPDTHAEMAVPIILEGQAVGVLDVQEDKIGGLDEGDASLLRSLANQVAVAIRNARLFAEVETALAEAHAAQERYLQQAWTVTKKIAHSSEHHYRQPGALPLDKTVAAQLEQLAIEQNQPAVVTVEGDDQDAETENQTALLAPIKLRDQVVGAIQLHQKEQQRWSERDLALVQAVAGQVAQAAENLRLFEETRQRAGREATIREITDKLRVAPNIDFLLETAVRELGARLGVQGARLKLGIEATPSTDGNGKVNGARGEI